MTTHVADQSLAENVRRTLLLLGSMPSPVLDPHAVAKAARFVHDRLARAGHTLEWFHPEDCAPLAVCGTGPVLVVSYLDDSDPFSSDHAGKPPDIQGASFSGPGIFRKSGVVAAMATMLDPASRDRFTFVIETDRNSGSLALARWLHSTERTFEAALWEAIDVPILTPAVIHSSGGLLSVRIATRVDPRNVESHYGSVVPDLGRALAAALANLVTEDHEVRLDGFYDGICDLDDAAIDTYDDSSHLTAAWLRRIAQHDKDLPSSHLATAFFLAPGISVQSVQVQNYRPFRPEQADAVIDIHLVPGQSPVGILQSIEQYFTDCLPVAEIQTLLCRPPVIGISDLHELRGMFPRVLSSVPGPSPASLFDSCGIPTIGYAVMARNTSNTMAKVTVSEIEAGARHIRDLADYALK